MANKKFIVKNGLGVTGDIEATGNIVVQGTITGDGSGLSGVTAYTPADFDSDLATKTTDDLTEGSNQYFTTARARAAMVAGDGINYDSATGVISVPAGAAVDYFDSNDFDIAFAAKTTDDLTEGSTNLYYDSATTVAVARNSIVGGTGVTYTAGTGTVAIGQSVGTGDNVTFGRITVDSAVTDGITFNRQAQPYAGHTPGTLFWDSASDKGLSFIPITEEGNDGVTINLGQEHVIYAQNTSGGPILNGEAVYIAGSETEHGHPIIAKAKADSITTFAAVGLATQDIADGQHGYVTQFGLVRGLNTSVYSPGQTLYVSPDSDGKFVTSAPASPNFPSVVGRVISVDSNEGTILVNAVPAASENVVISGTATVAGAFTAGNVSADYIDLNGTVPSHAEGRIFYDSANGALAVYNDEADITLQVGQEQYIRVYNNSGSDITDGKPVYYSGQHSGTPTIALADATDANKYNVRGLTTHTIENGSYGYVTLRGRVNNIDTSGLTAGQNFFLGLTPGALTNTSPGYPNFPMSIGYVATTDSSEGILIVDTQDHTVNSFRTVNDAHVGNDLTVGGNLTVLGTQTIASTENISIGGAFNYFNAGDTIGDANTQFTGTGLDDGTLKGHYNGTTTSRGFYVEIDGTGTPDTFRWAFDSDFSVVQASGVSIDGTEQTLAEGISIQFGATTGHDSGDRWFGTASPVNVDTGWFSNRNTGDSGIGYTHLGMFFDVSQTKFVALSSYDPEPEGVIDLSDSSVTYATIKAGTFEGNVTGNVTGNADTATLLQNSRTIAISGDVTGSATSFNGGSNITISSQITAGSIVNADINASAAIADTKLATISTSGKVQNSATTATANNTASAIVARDASGNFSAGTITATAFVGDGSGLTGLAPGYTATNFDSDFNTKTTDDLTQGSVNRYFSNTLARGAVSAVDAGGDGSFSYNSGTGEFTYTGPSASEVRAHFSAGTGLSLASGQYSISNTGVSAATYGDSSTIPVITVNAQGQITAVVGAGVNIPAGYDNTNFDSDLGTKTTDNLTEGATNLYHTTARARASISVTDAGGDGSLAYNSGTGVITYTGPSASEVRAHFSAGTGIGLASGVISNSGVLSVNGVTGAVTAGNLLTALLTVDGAGTGLDADLLDGQQGSYYRIDVYNAAGTLLN